jgi:hypothetical protein
MQTRLPFSKDTPIPATRRINLTFDFNPGLIIGEMVEPGAGFNGMGLGAGNVEGWVFCKITRQKNTSQPAN